MKFLNSRVIYSLLFYLLAILLIIVAKPSTVFLNDGKIKAFGVGSDADGQPKTVFSLGVFVLVLAVVSFYIFSVIDVIFGNKK